MTKVLNILLKALAIILVASPFIALLIVAIIKNQVIECLLCISISIIFAGLITLGIFIIFE